MSDVDNLGKVSPWQIREFPETLREDILKAAKTEQISVSEFVTRRMALLRDAGWPRELSSNGTQTVKPATTINPPQLLAAVTAVAATGVKVPGLGAWAGDLVREARGLPPRERRPTPRRLTHDQTVKPAGEQA